LAGPAGLAEAARAAGAAGAARLAGAAGAARRAEAAGAAIALAAAVAFGPAGRLAIVLNTIPPDPGATQALSLGDG
jgi:hypothetical protein